MATTTKRKWSQHVTETSDAMDVAKNTFTSGSAKKIAETVEKDSERSNRRKESPYRAAMSMLTFYINRAGKNLSPERKAVLEHAKQILREEYGPRTTAARTGTAKKSGTRKTASTSRKKRARRITAR